MAIKFPLFSLVLDLHFEKCKIITASKEWAFHVGVVLKKGQEGLGDSGGDDLLQAQKGIVAVQEGWKIRRQEKMRRASEEWHIEIRGNGKIGKQVE